MFRRFLFLVTIALSVGLAGLVLFAPLVYKEGVANELRDRLLSLFADDSTVRRTALASSAGLLATAFVFFRSKKTKPG